MAEDTLAALKAAWEDAYLAKARPGDMLPLLALRRALVERVTAARAVYGDEELRRDDPEFGGPGPLPCFDAWLPESIPPELSATDAAPFDVPVRNRSVRSLGGVRKIIYGLARFFIDIGSPEPTWSHGAPVRYSGAAIARSAHPMLRTPRQGFSFASEPAAEAYRRYLADCKHWLCRFRYVDARSRTICTGARRRSWMYVDRLDGGRPGGHEDGYPAWWVNGRQLGGGPGAPDPGSFDGDDTGYVVDGEASRWGAGLYAVKASHGRWYGRHGKSGFGHSFSMTQPAGLVVANPAPMAATARLWAGHLHGSPGHVEPVYETREVATVAPETAWDNAPAGRQEHKEEVFVNGYRRVYERHLEGDGNGATEHVVRSEYAPDGTLVRRTAEVTSNGLAYAWRNYHDVTSHEADAHGLVPAIATPGPPAGRVEPFGTLPVVPDTGRLRLPAGPLSFAGMDGATRPPDGAAYGGEKVSSAGLGFDSEIEVWPILDFGDGGYVFDGGQGATGPDRAPRGGDGTC